jgi:protein-S-isoprenylcysteine O-methyltransferase Ste14
MLILLGEVVFTRSVDLLIYMGLVGVAFYLFVVFYEESKLKKQFGEEYDTYRKKVNRWL